MHSPLSLADGVQAGSGASTAACAAPGAVLGTQQAHRKYLVDR